MVGLDAKWQCGALCSKMMKMSDGDSAVLNRAQSPNEHGTLTAWIICSWSWPWPGHAMFLLWSRLCACPFLGQECPGSAIVRTRTVLPWKCKGPVLPPWVTFCGYLFLNHCCPTLYLSNSSVCMCVFSFPTRLFMPLNTLYHPCLQTLQQIARNRYIVFERLSWQRDAWMCNHQTGLVILKISVTILVHINLYRASLGPHISDFLGPIYCLALLPCTWNIMLRTITRKKCCDLMGEVLEVKKKLWGLNLETYKDPGQKWSQVSWNVSTPRSLCDHQLIFLALWRKKLKLGGEVSWPRSRSYLAGGIGPAWAPELRCVTLQGTSHWFIAADRTWSGLLITTFRYLACMRSRRWMQMQVIF